MKRTRAPQTRSIALLALGVTAFLGACTAPEETTSVATPAEPQPTVIDGPFADSEGRTLLFIGQDSATIRNYAAAVPEHSPAGVTLYSSLTMSDPGRDLDGIFSARHGEDGETHFSTTLEEFPGAALALGLAFNDSLGCSESHSLAIAAGEYDESLARLVDYLAGLAPRPVYLRIGYEFDGPWNCYRPESHKAAFRRIHDALEEAGADHVATVWQSAAWPDPTIAGERAGLYDHRAEGHLDRWYPGDDAVDWVGVSIFYRDTSQWGYEPPDDPRLTQQGLLDFARAHRKPVMIAEAAPQGYRIGELTRSPIHSNSPRPVTADEIWEGWYRPFFDFVAANRDVVRAVAYIDTHWDTQAMWVCEPGVPAGSPGCANGNWGDTRVHANETIRSRWLEEILDTRRWSHDDWRRKNDAVG